MIFSPEEVQSFLNIIDRDNAILIARILGKEALNDEDLSILKKFNISPQSISKEIPSYWQSYLFGRLIPRLSDKQIKSLGWKDFSKYIREGQAPKPTVREIAQYVAAQNRTYNYIKGMATRQKEFLSVEISQAELLDTIHSKMKEGVVKRQSVNQIASNIGRQLKRWNQDWGRIVETELQFINTLGTAQVIGEEYGQDARVYFDVYPGACAHCIRLYLTSGVGSQPKLFRLKDLIENGTNIGRKATDWKAVLAPIHPYCRCQLRYLPKGYKWNEREKLFTLSPSQHKVERHSKIKITIGDRVFEV